MSSSSYPHLPASKKKKKRGQTARNRQLSVASRDRDRGRKKKKKGGEKVERLTTQLISMISGRKKEGKIPRAGTPIQTASILPFELHCEKGKGGGGKKGKKGKGESSLINNKKGRGEGEVSISRRLFEVRP